MIGAVRERIVERVITEKNFEFTGTVEAFGTNGEGIVHRGETVFFAPFTVVGEKVKFRALKVKGKVGYAKAMEILTPADERVRARCPVFTKCGGCQLQHLRYGAQLKLKSRTVRDTLKKIAGIHAEVPLAVKSENQFEYRNKLQIPVGVDSDGKTVIGFYAERSHRIVPVERCPIHPSWAADVIGVFKKYMSQCKVPGYDEIRRRGVLRHIVVREVEGAFIVTAVTYTEELPAKETLAAMLAEKFNRVSLWHNVNAKDVNTVFGEKFVLIAGDARYGASECGIRFEAGPNTFLQVNPGVCRKLYERAVRYAAQSGATAAINAYSGGGLLTAMLAKSVGKAYGIEIVPEAHECAEALKAYNKLDDKMIDLCGRVEDILPALMAKLDPKETFLLVDPPRKGIDRGTIGAILASGIARVAMISCNPSTMARDVGLLTGALIEENGELKKDPSYCEEGKDGYYSLLCVQPFDMFPQTKHVETLVLLSKKSRIVISK